MFSPCLTFVSRLFIQSLGSHDELLQALNDVRIGVWPLASGTLLRAGDWPALWKVGVDTRPEHYVSVNETIKALRVMDLGAMHYGSVVGGATDESVSQQCLAQTLRFAAGGGAAHDTAPVPLGLARRAGASGKQQAVP
ncbi:DUF3396 domain-containing protein [Pseudomonas xantholysinigenes]|uniref:DUF3396 domain-containing protein n=1 Tax=Pseudomonas xantholysinigenes TaxID=2745490 RepID=A0A9E6U239_9PSED|nr:DUF3396 domain-containing protein [Pseudomonas xantholysinigenes]